MGKLVKLSFYEYEICIASKSVLPTCTGCPGSIFDFSRTYSGLGLEKFVLVFDPTGHTTPARVQANMHGKTRAGVVCFSLERKKVFASPWRLFLAYIQ